MDDNQKNNKFLAKLNKEIIEIRSNLLSRLEEEYRKEFQALESIYENVVNQLSNSQSSEVVQSQQIFGQFLKTVKRFKRRNENRLKFQERDVDAFRKKWEISGQTFLPLIHDIKMNVNERLGKFDVEKLKDSNFQMHLYTNKELCDITFQMFEHQGYYSQLGIQSTQLNSLIKEICLTYNVIPYHNWSHAFSLFQMFFCCYYQSDLKNFLQPFEFFTGMLTGLVHDINHKGVNNLYKTKKRSEKALAYSDAAVLENMHCSTFFKLLHENPSLDITKTFPDANTTANFKRLLVSSILATDMGRHNKFVAKLKKRGQATSNYRTNKEAAGEVDSHFALKSDVFEDRRFITNILIHACDIGNPCLEFNNYMNWSYLVSQEFFDQTLKEERNGLEVTGFLKYKDKITFFGGQSFFSKVLVLPLWKEISVIFPDLACYPNQIEKNLVRIEEEKLKLQGQQ